MRPHNPQEEAIRGKMPRQDRRHAHLFVYLPPKFGSLIDVPIVRAYRSSLKNPLLQSVKRAAFGFVNLN